VNTPTYNDLRDNAIVLGLNVHLRLIGLDLQQDISGGERVPYESSMLTSLMLMLLSVSHLP
jgi:hypothetical protein